MAQSLIDILIRARSQGRNEISSVGSELANLDKQAALASQGIAALLGVAGIAALGAVAVKTAGEIADLAREAAKVGRLRESFADLAAGVGESSEAMLGALRTASRGAIADSQLILNANRANLLGVAKTSEELSNLLEVAAARAAPTGRTIQEAFEDITIGIGRESKLILDNLGIIVDIDKATRDYAATLGITAAQLDAGQRKQAILNQVLSESQGLLAANREKGDDLASSFERMDASLANAKESLGALFAPAVAVIAENIAKAAQSAAGQVEEFGKAAAAGDARGLSNVIAGLEEGLVRLKVRLAEAKDAGDFEAIVRAQSDLAEVQGRLTAATEQYFNAVRAAYPTAEANADALNRTSVEAEAAANAQRRAAEAAGALGANYDPLNIATNSLAAETAVLNEALSGTPGWMRGVARASIEAGNSLLQTAQSVVILKAQLADLEAAGAGARSSIINRAAGVAGIVGDARAVALAKEQIGQLDFAVGALKQQLKDGTLTQTEFDYQLARLDDTLTGTFDSIQEADAAAKRFAAQGLTDAKNAANAAQQAFDSLQSKVAGVLSGSLDSGVNLDELLPRRDSVEEDARRLADVAVNGFNSPWLDYFKDKFPALFQQYLAGATSESGIKTQAANLLRDFQDGLRPELLDKDTAKERVRRMLIGEQKLSDLAKEIATELSEEFGGVDQASILRTAQGALGVGGGGLLTPPDTGEIANQYSGAGSIAGATFADGVRASVVDGNLGNQVTAALDEQLRAESNLQRLEEGGRISGAAWGNGFLQTVSGSVPNALVELLASLVTPAVDALQRQNTSLQGAR